MKSSIPYNYTPFNPVEKYTEVRKSEIHGFGLFAKKLIPKDTIWWHARPQDVLIITKDQFMTLEASYQQTNDFLLILVRYSYYDVYLDALIFCLDNSRYVNHSFDANSGTSEELALNAIANRDIQVGEEITEDYSRYSLGSWLQKYKPFFDPPCL